MSEDQNKLDEKTAKFREIATRRTNGACAKIILLGNLSNRGAYHYTQEQVDAIFSALEKAIAETKSKFTFKKDTARSNFVSL
jgi:hypothetical protein